MQIIVIGAGPSGLACAACLKRDGHAVSILERADSIGSSWRGHYDRLHLHTVRGRSGLPHHPMPTHVGRYPSRDEMVGYLDDYAKTFGLTPRFGITVNTVHPDGTGWIVSHDQGADKTGAVVFATGLNGTPNRPSFPGQDSFPGQILHAHQYRNADPFLGQRALVIGFGNSGGDIALDLAEAGVPVTLSARSPINILPHELFGIPITSLGGLRKILPYRWADAITAPILRAKIGVPEDYGLQSAAKGPAAQVIEDGRVPLIDIGALAAIKAGKIATRPGLSGIDGRAITFADGSRSEIDTIILATGYRVDLTDFLPDTPQALDQNGRPRTSGTPAALPGLYFCSYRASPDGQLNQSGIEARAIAADLAKLV